MLPTRTIRHLVHTVVADTMRSLFVVRKVLETFFFFFIKVQRAVITVTSVKRREEQTVAVVCR